MGQLKRVEQKRTNPCTTRRPTQRPVRHRHWPPARSHGAIRPNATCSSRFSSAASATPIFIRSVTSGAMSCPRLAPREQLFHGVQALCLKPVGSGDIFGRAGLLAHTYMLGPNGDSNGCVSFKNYNSFLQAFQIGEVKRLVVVARLD